MSLRGAYAAIEGDDRALSAGQALAANLRMTAIPIPAPAKPLYHAGATMAANYTVALASIAEQLAIEAGVPADVAARIYLPLLRGTIANVEHLGSVDALTGAVRRGDTTTISAHLGVLRGVDRLVYAGLGLAALSLARKGGLDAAVADQVEAMLSEVLAGKGAGQGI